MKTRDGVAALLTGISSFGFGGFAREESRALWTPKIMQRFGLPVLGFAERSEFQRQTYVHFERRGRIYVIAVRTEREPELRVVTRAASPDVLARSGHAREPFFLEAA